MTTSLYTVPLHPPVVVSEWHPKKQGEARWWSLPSSMSKISIQLFCDFLCWRDVVFSSKILFIFFWSHSSAFQEMQLVYLANLGRRNSQKKLLWAKTKGGNHLHMAGKSAITLINRFSALSSSKDDNLVLSIARAEQVKCRRGKKSWYKFWTSRSYCTYL
jgi:hypothetical protein